MGLILAPAVIFWFIVAIFALKMGYSLIVSYTLVSHSVILILIAISSLSIYIFFVFFGFKSSNELGAFEIPVFFMLNKTPWLLFIVVASLHWFGGDYLVNSYLKPLPFIIIFTLSFGAIIGSFSADLFIEKFNIIKTY